MINSQYDSLKIDVYHVDILYFCNFPFFIPFYIILKLVQIFIFNFAVLFNKTLAINVN